MRFQKFNNIIDKTNNYIFRKAFIIFAITGLITTPVISYLFLHKPESMLESYYSAEASSIRYSSEVISDRVAKVTEDTRFLAGMLELGDYIKQGDKRSMDNFKSNLINFASLSKNYDQLRYLDSTGQELVRINYKSGIPYIVSQDDLQNKSKRYYFTGAISMDRNDVYISPIDLNMENGVLEMPFKPMMRFAAQVRDSHYDIKGVFVINYSVNEMFSRLKQLSTGSPGNIMLLNGDGYWLLSNVEDDQWGFMLSERDSRLFPNDYLNEWEKMKEADCGQFLTDKGLFTYQRLYILKNGSVSTSLSNDNKLIYHYSIVVLKHIPTAVMDKIQKAKIISTLEIISVIFILSCIPAWFIARLYTRKKLNREIIDISSKYDALTKLPNSASFQSAMPEAIKNAEKYRHAFAVMIISMDNYSHIVDTFGKKAGDNLVISLTDRIGEKLNERTYMARIKEDTFAVIVHDIKSSGNAEQTAAAIIQTAEVTNAVYGKESKTSLSIGISIYPESGYESSELTAKAEKAVISAKQSGSNSYRIFQP
ncbi:MAG: sensor domain-containing diguanylate cyclase [Deferribacterales bacterium]